MTSWHQVGAAVLIGWCIGGLFGIAYLAYRLAE
jgi:poly(3-hydroxyalkanoate) synthetase